MTGTVRLGFVGHGVWGRRLLGALRADERVKDVVIWDRDVARLATVIDAERAMSFDDLLARGLDCVAIAVDPREQPGLAVRALESGAHVFLEKPLALDVRSAARVRDAARSSGRVAFVGHVVRHHPVLRRAVESLEAGAIGAVRGAVLRRWGARPREGVSAWWVLGPHELALLDRVARGAPTWLERQGDEDDLRLRFRYDSGLYGELHVAASRASQRSSCWVGDQGVLVVDEKTSRLHRYASPTVARRALVDLGAGWFELERFLDDLSELSGEEFQIEGDALGAEVQAFLDAICLGKPVETDVEEGYRVVRALESGCGAGNTTSRIAPPNESTKSTPLTAKAT